MSSDITADYLEGSIPGIDSHIEFLRSQMEIVWMVCRVLEIKDKDKNLIKMAAKIAGLRNEKDRIKKKIKDLRA